MATGGESPPVAGAAGGESWVAVEPHGRLAVAMAGGEPSAAVEPHGRLAVVMAGGEPSAAVETCGRPAVPMADGELSLQRKAVWEVPSATAASAPPAGVSAWTRQAFGPLVRAAVVCGHRAAAL